jgi:holo-[acyl-carrier protein] synthase
MIKGVGVDSIELERVAGVYGRYGERFLARLFTRAERDYIGRWADPVPRIAGRFAVKEACMKALGTGWSGGVRWRDVEVLRLPAGKPSIDLHGEAARRMKALGADVAHCTITHSRDHAVAVVILESTA